MRKSHMQHVDLGPMAPLVPVRDFSRLRMKGQQWEDVWQIVGPSVARNLMEGCPLWRIIAAAYLEGLQHGAALAQEEERADG